jgi:hypothetical protein
MLTSTPLPTEQEDFSLVLGGPLYQLWRRLHEAGPGLDLVARRMIGIPLVAWLPLFMMTVHEGVAIGHAVPIPFLYDFYFQLFIWFLFLWRVSRLDLRLTPSHPDRAGGLGFLSALGPSPSRW